jgi:type II secretory ATPase GspE/PulE/Tfp pilus assembly ATPase PilB-like protein
MNDALREAVNKRFAAEIIHKLAIENGMVSLFDDGMLKAKMGITSLEEVLGNLMEK